MIIAGIILILSGILTVGISEAAARGTLGINSLAGIRTRAVMMSEEAWTAGHKAARWHLDAAGLVAFLAGAALVTLPLDESTTGPWALASAVLIVVLVVLGAIVATPAANRALVDDLAAE